MDNDISELLIDATSEFAELEDVQKNGKWLEYDTSYYFHLINSLDFASRFAKKSNDSSQEEDVSNALSKLINFFNQVLEREDVIRADLDGRIVEYEFLTSLGQPHGLNEDQYQALVMIRNCAYATVRYTKEKMDLTEEITRLDKVDGDLRRILPATREALEQRSHLARPLYFPAAEFWWYI